MKRKIIILILTLFIITGCNKEDQNNQKTLNFTEEKSKYNFAEIYEFEDGSKVYSEFANIYFVLEDEKISLRDALKLKKITVDEIIKKMTYESEVNDGGSKLYSYNVQDNDLSDTDFMLVKCHRIIDTDNSDNTYYNTDIILGTTSSITEKCNTKN